MIEIVGNGMYGKWLHKTIGKYYNTTIVASRGYSYTGASVVLFACKPDQAYSLAKSIPIDTTIIDVTSSHRMSYDWQQVTPFTTRYYGNRFSMMGCMASLAAMLYSLFDKSIWKDMNMTTLISPSVAGKESITDIAFYDNHPQGIELSRYLGVDVSINPILHGTFDSGIVHRVHNIVEPTELLVGILGDVHYHHTDKVINEYMVGNTVNVLFGESHTTIAGNNFGTLLPPILGVLSFSQ